MANSTRNAHSKTAEKLDKKVGQWSFCKFVLNLIISFLFLIKHNFIISELPTSEASQKGEAQRAEQ